MTDNSKIDNLYKAIKVGPDLYLLQADQSMGMTIFCMQFVEQLKKEMLYMNDYHLKPKGGYFFHD